MTQIIHQPLAHIAEALRDRRVSASDLAAAAMEAHNARGAALAAYKTWDAEGAERAATAADAAFAAGADLGPLHGIPVSVKDIYGVSGLPTFAGTPKQLPPAWEREGPLVARLRRQLALIMGKTHTVEFAFGGLGVNNHWGTPRNPWDAETHRVPGGSSAGAGVSLCEGSALLALGTDTAGSVRIPASMTGTVGLKTGFGRWPVDGIVPLSPTLDTAGVLTRSVADACYAFATLDAAWGNPQDFAERTRGLPVSHLRIGTGAETLWEDCSPGVAEAVQQALEELSSAGAHIIELPMPEAAEAIALLRLGSVVSAECDAFLESELPAWRETLDPIITSRIADGGDIPAREYLLRLRRLKELGMMTAARFAKVDVIAAPTVAITPPALSEVGTVKQYRPSNFGTLRNTCVANYCRLCALTLPVGLDRAGMPVGLQLMAPHGSEERLLAVGRCIEDVLGDGRQRLGVAPMLR